MLKKLNDNLFSVAKKNEVKNLFHVLIQSIIAINETIYVVHTILCVNCLYLTKTTTNIDFTNEWTKLIPKIEKK